MKIFSTFIIFSSLLLAQLDNSATITKTGTTAAQFLKIGVDAFIIIWAQLKYWKVLSILVKTPIVYTIAKITYKLFANYRFKKLTHCQMASQKVN